MNSDRNIHSGIGRIALIVIIAVLSVIIGAVGILLFLRTRPVSTTPPAPVSPGVAPAQTATVDGRVVPLNQEIPLTAADKKAYGLPPDAEAVFVAVQPDPKATIFSAPTWIVKILKPGTPPKVVDQPKK